MLAARVDDLAGRLDRSPGWVVKQALTAWVEQEDERHWLTLAALSDAGAGRTVEHETCQGLGCQPERESA